MSSQPSRLAAALFSISLLVGTVGIMAAPSSAHAAFTLAGDIDGVAPLDRDYLDVGAGFGIRLGAQLHVPLLVITPEIGFNYASFGGSAQDYRGIVGGRVGIGELVRGGVFAHIGFGHVSYSVADIVEISHTGVTLDAGAFLDLTLIPLLDIGVHAGYGQITGNDRIDALKWINFGAHVALVF